MAVHDQRRPQLVGRQLVPDHVGVAGQHRRAPVAEVRRHRGARADRIGDLRRRRIRMGEGDTHAHGHGAFDDRQRAGHLGRQRQQADLPVCRVLAAPEVVHRGIDDAGQRVRTAEAILRRDVRPFHVQARDDGVPGGEDPSRAVAEVLERRRDDGRQAEADTRGLHRGERDRDLLRRDLRVVVDAGEAVDLQIDECGAAVLTHWGSRECVRAHRRARRRGRRRPGRPTRRRGTPAHSPPPRRHARSCAA